MLQKFKVSKMPMDQKRVQIKEMSDNYLIAILERLREWSQNNTIGVKGYKSSTIEHQLMTEGALVKVTGGFVVDDIECEIVDSMIAKMPPRMKKAIKGKYLFNFTNKDAASDLKISISTYKRFIIRCREYLCQRMSGKI
jgi:Sigma-70, region 4